MEASMALAQWFTNRLRLFRGAKSYIGLYIPVFPTVLHSVVAYESIQITLLLSTFNPKTEDEKPKFEKLFII